MAKEGHKYVYAWPKPRSGYRYTTDDALKAYRPLKAESHIERTRKGKADKLYLRQPGRRYTINSAAYLKRWVRQVKPEHEASLLAVEQAIDALNKERKALIEKAFKQGWVVTLKEAERVADEQEANRIL
jgi:hypothetical protein